MREFLVTAFMVGVGCVVVALWIMRRLQRHTIAGGGFR